MIRSDMNRIISLLETSGFDANRDEILSSKNAKAVKVLIDTGCVDVTRAWGGDIVDMRLLNHASTYQLERQDVWINRFIGFVSGVGVTVVATILLHVLL